MSHIWGENPKEIAIVMIFTIFALLGVVSVMRFIGEHIQIIIN